MKSRRSRLSVEALEDRTTPASVSDLYACMYQTFAGSAVLRQLQQNPALLANPALRPATESYFKNMYQTSVRMNSLIKEFPHFLSPGMESLVGAYAAMEGNTAKMVGGMLGFRVAPSTPTTPTVPTDSGMTNTKPSSTDSHFVNLGNGLKIWDVVQGHGSAVQPFATVKVFYTGWLSASGTKFDSKRSPALPASFKLAETIPGWRQGVVGMKDGGIRRLLIPAALAYGAAGSGSVPPNADLIFEIKLVSHTPPTPGVADVAHSTVSVSSPSVQSGGAITVTLTAKDVNGVPETRGGLTVAFGLGTGVGRGTFGAVTDHGNGTYTATLIGSTVGPNTITATIGGVAVTTTLPTINVVGAADLAHSTVSITPSTVQAGGTTTVTLTAKDANGIQETRGGLTVTFGVGSGSAHGTFSTVTDHGDGTYTATFTGTLAGTNTLTATIGGQAITTTLPTLTVVGPADPAHSLIALALSSIHTGSTTTVTLTAKDANGVQETKGGATVVFALGTGVGRGTFSAVTDHGNGIYTAILTGTTLGPNTITATLNGIALTSAAAPLTVTA